MGDFFRDNPDAIGAVFSTIIVLILTSATNNVEFNFVAPAIGYVFALLISRHLLKKGVKEKAEEYSSKLSAIKNEKHLKLENYTRMSNNLKDPEQMETVKKLLKTTVDDIERLDKMEMDDLMEVKREVNKGKITIQENSHKLSKAVNSTKNA